MIRVVLVDDSPVAIALLRGILEASGTIEVVGAGSNGVEGLALVRSLSPDVVLTDLNMPIMDGNELIEALMEEHPLPILVVSSWLDGGRVNLRALELGALDVMAKPTHAEAVELVRKVRQLAGVKVFRRPARHEEIPVVARAEHQVVVLGASTGGPPVLLEVLRRLPADFPTPILAVQHIAANFLTDMVSWLDQSCPLSIRVAGDRLEVGTVQFAPGHHQLHVEPGGRLRLTAGPPEEGHNPSVNVTMRSAAAVFGAGSVGVLMTGMGADGADGLLAIRRAGGVTIAQNEETCAVWGMPAKAVEIGAAQHLLSPIGIARMLRSLEMSDSAR